MVCIRNFKLLPWAGHGKAPRLTRFPRAAEIKTNRQSSKRPKKLVTKRLIRGQQTKKQVVAASVRRESIVDLLLKRGSSGMNGRPTEEIGKAQQQKHLGQCNSFCLRAVEQFLEEGRGNPWITRASICDPVRICPAEADRTKASQDPDRLLASVSNLNAFVWDPKVIDPGLEILCPACSNSATQSEWRGPRFIYQLDGFAQYMVRRYVCYDCSRTVAKPGSRRRKRHYFLADHPNVLGALPAHVRNLWQFLDTGRHLCHMSLVDLVRSMATKCSWAGIAETIQDMMMRSWRRESSGHSQHEFSELTAPPGFGQNTYPEQWKLTAPCVKRIFVLDFAVREPILDRVMEKETGDDILRVDWTQKAAAQCGATYLLNVMDGGGRILISEFTENGKPYSAEQAMQQLYQRGCQPKVVYVDEECCGQWPKILGNIWPDAAVRLDPLHAMMRLTQATTSTQHPCHGSFCAGLSKCFFRYDDGVYERLRRAWTLEHGSASLPAAVVREHVPRVMRQPSDVSGKVDELMEKYLTMQCCSAGPLLTAATRTAWQALLPHIERGCLSDPCEVALEKYGEIIKIGGQDFQKVKSLRGTSQVEGLHAHQKCWLGQFGQHGRSTGQALLKEGAYRWNRSKLAAEQKVSKPSCSA